MSALAGFRTIAQTIARLPIAPRLAVLVCSERRS
jgi:hypothetical protein